MGRRSVGNGLLVDPKFILLPLFNFLESNLFYYLRINFDEYGNLKYNSCVLCTL